MVSAGRVSFWIMLIRITTLALKNAQNVQKLKETRSNSGTLISGSASPSAQYLKSLSTVYANHAKTWTPTSRFGTETLVSHVLQDRRIGTL